MSASVRGRRVASAAFAVSCAVSLYALLTPDVPGGGLVDVPGADKAVHVALFALLAATASWRFGTGARVLAGLVLYGALSEALQAAWLDRRGGDLADLAADVAGITAGVALARAWRPAAMGSVPLDDPT